MLKILNRKKNLLLGLTCIFLIWILYHFSQSYIPYTIYMTWETKPLPPKMQENVNRIQAENYEFKVKIFDDTERREFIAKHFNSSVVNAYDTLIPGAYRADLWRYCILYIHGGIYLDMDMKPINGFRFKFLMDNKEYFVRDRDIGGRGIWNGMIVAFPANNILLRAIHKIVKNVKNREYGPSLDLVNSLYPTGPMLLKTFFSEDDIDNLKYMMNNSLGPITITSKDKSYRDAILTEVKHIKLEQDTPYYMKLWKSRKIYRNLSVI